MKPIILIGYMGCGKSSFGRKLARRLEVGFADTDSLVEEHEGATVSDVFQYEGEQRFRELEREALEAAFADSEVGVISSGGGLPAWKDNMARMNQAGLTLYLRRTPEQIARRLSPYGRQKRPKLRGLNDDELIDYMTHNMAEREPFYSQAQLVVECGDTPDAELLELILEKLQATNG